MRETVTWLVPFRLGPPKFRLGPPLSQTRAPGDHELADGPSASAAACSFALGRPLNTGTSCTRAGRRCWQTSLEPEATLNRHPTKRESAVAV